MANHASSVKRIRQTEKRRLHNRFYAKVTRNAVKKFRAMNDQAEAKAFLPKVFSMLDKALGLLLDSLQQSDGICTAGCEHFRN